MTREQDADGLRRAFEALSTDASFTTDCPPAERIWSGARGELAPADVEQLSAHLATCGACAAVWRAAMDFGPEATGLRPVARASVLARWVLPLAAVMVLSVGGYVVYDLLTRTQPESVGQVARGSDVPLPLEPRLPLEPAPLRIPANYALVWRGAGSGKEFLGRLADALYPYQVGNYAEAVNRLTKLTSEQPDLPEPAFYLGVSQLMVGRWQEAIAALTSARVHAPADLAADIEWYLALADERAGRAGQARERLQTLCGSEGPARERACAGLKLLGGP